MANSFTLEIDGGNSSYKWRLISGEEVFSSGRFSMEELLPGFEAVLRGLDGEVNARIVSVAGVQADQQLINALDSLNVGPLHFARVSPEKAGVRCGYEDVSQLGVDRWLAVLAASNEFEGAVAVADFGSALTLDFVDSGRNYVGGYIVPGWGLMCQSLIEGTAIDVSRIPYEFESGGIEPGTSSAAAIGQGRLLMLTAFVNSGVVRFESAQGEKVTLVCTGGDAFRIVPFLDVEAEVRPDLVMDGLSLALA